MKKSMLTLFAFSALISTNINGFTPVNVNIPNPSLPAPTPSYNTPMSVPSNITPKALQSVQDANGNIIGIYQPSLSNAQGYTYGTFYPAPVSVIQGSGNLGTPVWLSVPGASSTAIGSFNNPNYKGGNVPKGLAGGPTPMINLYQYTQPTMSPGDAMPSKSMNHPMENNHRVD